MSLLRWRIGLGLAACLLALAGRAAAQDSSKGDGHEPKAHQQPVYHTLTSVHNYGANLYNNGDWAGCYHLFEGSLMTLLPHLEAHHADLHKSVKDALTLAQADPSMVNRAWILREALLKVRKAHAPAKDSGKPEDQPRTKPEDKPKPKPEEENPPITKKKLWDRLGGEKGVTRIVDDIVATAAKDPKVNFFRDGKIKLDAAGMRRFKQHMVQEASALTDGPLHYEGEDMKKAHKGMGITNAEFDAFMGHVKDALEKNKVGPADSATIMSALGAKRKDIVEAKKPGDKPEDNKPETDKPGKEGHVSGKVTFQGKPLSGSLSFHPATGTGKSITTPIKDGDYSVDVLPGEYVVTVGDAGKIKVPNKYQDKKTSDLRVKVKAGKQAQDLELQP